ncbi:MAG: hypothetical protein FWG70_10530 [Oscillospiraceae bacterium]|nr:hypothetical protein [Oscillospiraceae bacterium]
MKKIFISISLLFILCACDPYAGKRPTDQEGTFWLSENPQIYFAITNGKNIGHLKTDNDIIEIKFHFAPGGAGTEMINNGINFYSGFGPVPDVLLLIGDDRYSKNQYIFTVSYSEIESIEVGDKITFNRVEEFPDWALEMDSDASLKEASEE